MLMPWHNATYIDQIIIISTGVGLIQCKHHAVKIARFFDSAYTRNHRE